MIFLTIGRGSHISSCFGGVEETESQTHHCIFLRPQSKSGSISNTWAFNHHWGDAKEGHTYLISIAPPTADITNQSLHYSHFSPLSLAHLSKTVRGRNLQPPLAMTKNNLSGVLFAFDCSKTFFIYSHFVLQTKPESQQEKALELKSFPILSASQNPTSPTPLANSLCSPATNSSIWNIRRPEAQTDMAPILDLEQDGERGRIEVSITFPESQCGRTKSPHSTDLETGAQRGYCVTQGHTVSKQGLIQDLNPGPADFRIPTVKSHSRKHGCWSESDLRLSLCLFLAV